MSVLIVCDKSRIILKNFKCSIYLFICFKAQKYFQILYILFIMFSAIMMFIQTHSVEVEAAGGFDILRCVFRDVGGQRCIFCYPVKHIYGILENPEIREYFDIPGTTGGIGHTEYYEYNQIFHLMAHKYEDVGVVKIHGKDYQSFGYEWLDNKAKIKRYTYEIPNMPDVLVYRNDSGQIQIVQTVQYKTLVPEKEGLNCTAEKLQG